MIQDMGAAQWANVGGSTAVVLACAAFGLVYHLRAAWWRTDVGRNLMAFAAAVGTLCLYTVLITLWPDGCPAAMLRACRAAVLVVIAVLMVQRTRMVLRAQQHHDRTGV